MDTLSTTVPVPGELPRVSLLARVRAAAPAVLTVVAPAGFGKSTLARQAAAVLGEATAVCECAREPSAEGGATALDLARRLPAALAAEEPGRAAALARDEAMISDGGGSAAERVARAVAAWAVPPGRRSAFVFDDVEELLGDPAARALLTRLLATRPDARTVILCSREPLRLRLTRFASPHRIMALRGPDLAFDAAEIAALFGAGATDETLRRVADETAGWPIAVLLLARLAREDRLGTLPHAPSGVAHESLREYAEEHVLSAAPDAAIDALLACSALPGCGETDVRAILGAATPDPAGMPDAWHAFSSFVEGSPFVTRDASNGYRVHALLGSALRARYAARLDTVLASLASAAVRAGDHQRAAEIALAHADAEGAAAALERVDVSDDDGPSLRYARVLASLDRATVMRHPRLWSLTALLRAYVADAAALLDEADTVWARAQADAPATRIYVAIVRVLISSVTGDFERGLRIVEELRASIGIGAAGESPVHGWLLYLRAVIGARLGRLADAERDVESAWPYIVRVPAAATDAHVALGADVARVRGDRTAERDRIARALSAAQSAGMRNAIALVEAEAALGAWLTGEEAACDRHAATLEGAVERDALHAFTFFASALRSRAHATGASGGAGGDETSATVREQDAAGYLKWSACGHLVAASSACDREAARRHAEKAREAAAGHGSPYYRVLAALALGALDPARRDAMHAEAAELAQTIDAPRLQRAVGAVARGEDGDCLAPFVARYRRDAVSASAEAPRLVVEVVRGRVLAGGSELALPEREHALLTVMATRPEGLGRERIADLLWPDHDQRDARNAFHVCMHRLKARIAGDDLVVRNGDTYRLAGAVRVDLWEIDRALARARAADADDAARTAALRDAYALLRAERPAKIEAWDWFEPTERRLRELRCETAQALANAALAEGRPADALALCREMIAYDPCDEPAREIAIRAYLHSGDRAAALRHYRQYRDVLMAELQCEPSESLARLVGAAP